MCRMPWFFAPVLLALLVLASVPVLADWDPEDGHKMHYPQLPDPNGWDVSASVPSAVADDWMCTETGYVSDIHIWGSWFNDEVFPIVGFHLEIWSDQPANGVPFSHPRELLWGHDFPAGTFIERPYGDSSLQGWFDPFNGVVEPDNHWNTWQYNFFIPEGEAFIQEEGTIYWLVVQIVLDGPPVWGWKTSLDHWNDDSVFLDEGGGWQELFDPILVDPPVSLDQAFVITGEPLPVDWGDAPDQPYPTLAANNGANHTLGGGLMLGVTVDAEPDGQPDATATGDDLAGSPDDEDGVTFQGPLVPGQNTQMTVVVSAPCDISAWIDFNANSSWLDPIDLLFSGLTLPAGPNVFLLPIPAAAIPGFTFARFRVTTTGALTPTGNAPDGEVEDYQVFIDEPPLMDFGDAPDPSYPTLFINNGARHIIDGATFMGGPPDAEPDGQPHPNAMGDDLANLPDEDGVLFTSPLIPGFNAFVDVNASVPGFLDAWIDFDGNGDWTDPHDQIFTAHFLNPGINNLIFQVPAGIASTPTFARFRFSAAGGLGFDGQAPEGEVEDYEVMIEDPIHDWGDAPDPLYPTLSTSTGAVHTLVEGVYLGVSMPDAELDGQPEATALGDDNDGFDDEDGVIHSPGTVVSGGTVNVTVTASINGFINAWVDFNSNGSWSDTGDQVFTNTPVVAGANSLSFTAPATVVTPTFARYRFDTIGGLTYTGPATDGEIEDYYLTDLIFSDGFESGDTTEWSNTVP